MNPNDDILRYRAAISQNRETFLLNFKTEFAAFDQFDKLFPHFAAGFGAGQAPHQKSDMQLIPFLPIMQRSARSAFDNLSAYQSCHAWIALRPFVEAALIMGKWIDDPQNATIWISRNAGKNARKLYQDAYSGDSLRSQRLPGSDTIRQVLSRIGDEFLQTNLHYYTHAITLTENNSRQNALRMDSMDDAGDHRAHIYAFLHLIWFVMHSLGRMLEGKFGAKPEFRVDLGKMEQEFAPTVVAIARQNEVHRTVLTQLGLWPHSLLQPPK